MCALLVGAPKLYVLQVVGAYICIGGAPTASGTPPRFCHCPRAGSPKSQGPSPCLCCDTVNMGSCCSSDKGQDPTMPLLGKEDRSNGSPQPMSDAAPSPSTDPGYENLACVPAPYNPPCQIDRTKSLREQKLHATSQQADLAGKLVWTLSVHGSLSLTPFLCCFPLPNTTLA